MYDRREIKKRMSLLAERMRKSERTKMFNAVTKNDQNTAAMCAGALLAIDAMELNMDGMFGPGEDEE